MTDNTMSTGQLAAGNVAIVGAGPGDPDLITVAGVHALEAADVVLYDALASPALLRHAAGAELVYVGKRAGRHAMRQDEINACIVEHAHAGKRVVRLKGGDPFVFGRGSEEALACREAGVPFAVVPGITSAIAAPAYAGIPVTHRGLSASFMVITGNRERETAVDWDAAARVGTLLILMGASNLDEIMAALMDAGKLAETPVACVRWGTRADQEVVSGTVGTIAEAVRTAELAAPIVTVVGEVAALRERLDWFAPGPLSGKRIVVTRARVQASDLAERLTARGAQVVEAPVIGVELHGERLPLTEGVGTRWDWIIFTSANGVQAFFAELYGLGLDTRVLGTTRIASIGAATSDVLKDVGIVPDFVPSKATSDVLAEEINRVHGARILLPVSSLTDRRLSDALRKRGGHIEQIAAYDTHPEPLDEQQLREVLEAHAITFTSASTARNLRAALGNAELSVETKLVSIGAETSKAMMEAFGRVDAEAETPSLDALVDAVRRVL
jgi:uroporphyrinogen III methyltransferase/synthase